MTLPRRTFLGALAAAAVSAACGTTSRQSIAPSLTSSPSRALPSAPSAAISVPTGPAREVDFGRRDRPLVALTFHGQGDPALAAALLAEAERSSAQLTVFTVGSWLEANPAMAQRIRTGGHELANHTQHHLPMAAMGETQAYQEFAGCAVVLRRLTGSVGRWVRPSGTPHGREPRTPPPDCVRPPVGPATGSASGMTWTPWTTPIQAQPW